MSHTPGPWTAKRDFRKHGAYIIEPFAHDSRKFTQTDTDLFLERNSDYIDESIDNALLIEAAPDLFAAAQAILEYVHRRPGQVPLWMNRDDRLPALKRAMDKAKGR